MRFTEKSISKIEPPASGQPARDVPDDLLPGLYLTIQTSGVKSWTVRYRINGQRKRFTLGRVEAIPTPADARKRARRILEKVAEGIDPQAAKLVQRTRDNTEGFRALAIKFIELHHRPRNRSWRESARVLGLRLKADGETWEDIKESPAQRWADRPVRTITKRDVVDEVDRAVQRGPIAGNKCFANLQRFFGWCIERGVIDVSPMTGMRLPSPIKARKRALSIAELNLVFNAAGELDEPFGAFVRLLVLTGQRRNEAAGLHRNELDGSVWTIPAERSKNGTENVLPLPTAAHQMIEDLPGNGLLLTTTGTTPISGFSKMKRHLDGKITKLNAGKTIPHFTLHDLRRSVATGMASIGIAPHVVEAVLNHRSGEIKGVAAIYNRWQYLPEKEDALKRWADAILSGVIFGAE
ncbi:site-specific integrase [Hyphomicrobium sp. D-2]|uniref:tyrosine-type recombinase/integrase n=1 Tax=Hyphomicrobium sp. D-2 TaxID=3041621 RepID=UPI0024572FF2|nr:site-specific integrase [Hyphomicrobium sp. D-2]MDH4983256.1 site-specific integrase [Hyphomicrobium sp. D-2]